MADFESVDLNGLAIIRFFGYHVILCKKLLELAGRLLNLVISLMDVLVKSQGEGRVSGNSLECLGIYSV